MVKPEHVQFELVSMKRTYDSEMIVGTVTLHCEGFYNAECSDKDRERAEIKRRISRQIGYMLFGEVIARLDRIERAAALVAPGDWQAQEKIVSMVAELRASLEW